MDLAGVLVLAGVVCQAVSQRHQTLRKAFVDGVTPSRRGNRVWAQHCETHTHTRVCHRVMRIIVVSVQLATVATEQLAISYQSRRKVKSINSFLVPMIIFTSPTII